MIADAEFCQVGEIGVGGPEFLLDFGIGLRPLVRIWNVHSDRRAQGFSLVHPRDYGNRIRFLALSGNFALARPSAIQFELNLFFGDGQIGWASVHHYTDSATVAFPPCGDGKQFAESIGHERQLTEPGLARQRSVGQSLLTCATK